MTSRFLHAPPPSFQGLNPHSPVRVYKRHLPHWRQDGATYFVTYRLADSLPSECLADLKSIRLNSNQALENANEPTAEEKSKTLFEQTEKWLDQGYGACLLRKSSFRGILADSLQYFDGKRYGISCYVIMPNHIHLIIRPYPNFDLEKILQSQKRFVSNQINKLTESKGTLWQAESHDRIIRDPQHLRRCINYIGRNPGKARLKQKEFTRWIRPEWKELGWGFPDE